MHHVAHDQDLLQLNQGHVLGWSRDSVSGTSSLTSDGRLEQHTQTRNLFGYQWPKATVSGLHHTSRETTERESFLAVALHVAANTTMYTSRHQYDTSRHQITRRSMSRPDNTSLRHTAAHRSPHCTSHLNIRNNCGDFF